MCGQDGLNSEPKVSRHHQAILNQLVDSQEGQYVQNTVREGPDEDVGKQMKLQHYVETVEECINSYILRIKGV